MTSPPSWPIAIGSLLVLLLTFMTSPTAGAVARTGNPIVAGRGTQQARTAYLLDRELGASGVVFAMSAYFLSLEPVIFQLWRLHNSSSGVFVLKHQWEYTAIKAERREDVYLWTLQNATCVKVQAQDRFGIYIRSLPGPVAYDFTSDPHTLRSALANGAAEPQPGDPVFFDNLSWPNKFSVSAYIDTDLSKYPVGDSVQCPDNISFPPETDGYENGGTTPQVPKEGATGATGPAGANGGAGSTGPRGERGPNGERGATGPEGPMGNHGATGSTGRQGATGPLGPLGGMGATGPRGVKGDSGARGPPGPKANATNSATFEELISECEWCQKFLNPYLILGVIIWLALVTLLLLITLIIVTCHRRQRAADNHYQNNLNGKANSDLWKKYENSGFDGAQADAENNYSSIPGEGRTAF